MNPMIWIFLVSLLMVDVSCALAKGKAAPKHAAAVPAPEPANPPVVETPARDSSGDSGASATGESSFILVRETDWEGKNTFKCLAPADYRQRSHEIDAMNKALPQAYAKLRKEWRLSETKTDKKKVGKRSVNVTVPPPPFPLKCPPPLEIRQLGTFTAMDKLDEKKRELESAEDHRQSVLAKEQDGAGTSSKAQIVTPS